MALLEGLVGGADSVMKFGQQQFENKLAKDKFDEQKRQYDQSYEESVRQFNVNDEYNKALNERQQQTSDIAAQKEKERLLTLANDKIYKTYQTAGYLNDDRLGLNYNKINEDIAAGRGSDRYATAEQIILGFATEFGNLPEGSKATSVEALEGGGYAITVTNADGSKGAVTEDGSSGPESSVVRFQPGQLGRLANSKFQTEVVVNTSRFNPDFMRDNLDLIDGDSGVQGVRDDEQDFLVEQKYKKTVTQAAEQTGNVAVARGVETAIADGGMETAQAIGDDLGVPRPTVSTDEPASKPADDRKTVNTDAAPTAQTDDSEPAPQPTKPWSLENVDRSTKGGRLIRSIEGAGATRSKQPLGQMAADRKGSDWFKTQQTEKLMARKAKLEELVAAGPKGPNPNMNAKVAGRMYEDRKSELDQINAYLEKDQVAVFSADLDPVAEQTEGKTTKEIEEGINDGTIKVSKAEQERVAAELKKQGVREIRDLKRLKAKDAAIARAAIISSSPDATVRARMSQEIVNIFDNAENSPSVQRKDELALADRAANRTYSYRKLRNDIAKTRRSWNDAANTEAADVLAGAQDVFFGPERDEENFDYDSAAKFLRGKPFNKFNIWLKQSDRTAEEIANAMPGMSATLSLTIAAMAGEESGGRGITGSIRESVIDFMGRDEVEEAVDPADFDASRIRVDDPEKPTMLYYTDEDGNILDEEGGMQALKNLHPEMYANAMSIGIHNTRVAMGE